MKKRIAQLLCLCLLFSLFSFISCDMEQPPKQEDENKSESEKTPDDAFSEGENEIMTIFPQGCIVVTDYFENDGVRDVADDIQKVIDENPNRSIYFPDGTYVLSHSLLTSANPKNSVSLYLTDYAVLKATSDFKSGTALVNLGGKEAYNNVRLVGSNYGIYGGVLDCNGVANGVEISSGRETKVQNVSIKNCVEGIWISHGANSGSADADISNCNIQGTARKNSVGIRISAADNSVSNVRIGRCATGVITEAGGNLLSNVHPLFAMGGNYASGIGFLEKSSGNTFYRCYSDQFATAFMIENNGVSVYTDCWAFWYTGDGGTETAFYAKDQFNAHVTNLNVGFSKDTENTILKCGAVNVSEGFFTGLLGKPERATVELPEKFIK